MNALTPTLALTIAPEQAAQARAVDALIDRAFGPGRYTKVSERLREGNRQRIDLSFVATAGEQVVGAVRQWPVLVGETRGLFLGPIAVEMAWRQHGVGADLIEHAVLAGAAAGEPFVILVGDLPLFGPHGFEVVPRRTVTLPGPVDPNRLLWRALRPGGLDGVSGHAHVPRHD
jgi:predicted N-acetyltransferase YhbS